MPAALMLLEIVEQETGVARTRVFWTTSLVNVNSKKWAITQKAVSH